MLLSVFNLISKRSSVEVYAWNCLPELLFELLAALSIGLKVLAAVIRGEKVRVTLRSSSLTPCSSPRRRSLDTNRVTPSRTRITRWRS